MYTITIYPHRQNLRGYIGEPATGNYYPPWDTVPNIAECYEIQWQVARLLPETTNISTDVDHITAVTNTAFGEWLWQFPTQLGLILNVQADGGYLFFPIPSQPANDCVIFSTSYVYDGCLLYPYITWGEDLVLETLYPLYAVFYDWLGEEGNFHQPPGEIVYGTVGQGHSTPITKFCSPLTIEWYDPTVETHSDMILDDPATGHIIEINKLIAHHHPGGNIGDMVTGNDVAHGDRASADKDWWHYHAGHETRIKMKRYIGNWLGHTGFQHR